MRRIIIFLALTLVLLGIFIAALLWWRENSKPVSPDTSTFDFLVVRGRGASQIAQELKEQGLIRSPLAFKIYVQVTAKSKKILSGQFQISPSFSLIQVTDTLTKPPAELWVTIPEGLRREEVVERFIKALEIKEFGKEAFREEFLSESEDLEGFLYPDTYLFPRTVSGATVVSRMRSTFYQKTKALEAKFLVSSDLSLAEMVTLASIVERETRTDEERPVVAGILLNRLEIGMGLQADPTVQYAVATVNCQLLTVNCDDWWPILTKEDLSINSPYNTYRFRGLPPAPIASPGISALRAALSPEDSLYLYYLHDAEGEIHYAETLSEHNENVRIYLGK